MQKPEDDIENRQIVWDAMHVLWLDTETELFNVDAVARDCAATSYSVDDLEQIYWLEVYPLMRQNLMHVAGEWSPFYPEELKRLVLQCHRFGKEVWFKKYRRHAFDQWNALQPKIVSARAETIDRAQSNFVPPALNHVKSSS